MTAAAEVSGAPAVEARGLVLTHGDHVALAASDLVLAAGTVTTVIGPNGSGKSTLLSAIAGLTEPVGGGLSVLGGSPRAARPRVAYVLQGTGVSETLPVSVAEVVAMGRYASRGLLGRFTAADRAAVRAAMERLDVVDLARRHLHELSGGQRQRVFVAQGLAQEADLLLLDEPLTGLDLASQQAIAAVIAQQRASGATVVMTTHDLADAATADYVVLLAGRVVASGSPADVLTVEHLSEAYGIHALDGHRVLVDDPHHDDHRPGAPHRHGDDTLT